MSPFRSFGWWFVGLIWWFSSFSPAAASWFSEITGVDIDLNNGTITVNPPNPSAIVPMIQNLPKDVGQALLNPAAPALATAIRSSKGQALNRGVQGIPQHIRAALAAHFPAAILDRARWTTAGGGISLDSILANWLGQEGAVTLDDVVVFSDSNLAINEDIQSIELWAHELTHIIQYQNMGVESFAFAYTTNWGGIEGQARDNAARIRTAIGAGLTVQNSYSLSAGAFSSQIPWQEYSQVARQVIQPVSCIWINNGMTGNQCPIPVMVSAVIVRDPSGQTLQYPCNAPTCFFPPGASGPLISPPGTQIVGVMAAYQPF